MGLFFVEVAGPVTAFAIARLIPDVEKVSPAADQNSVTLGVTIKAPATFESSIYLFAW